MNKRYLTLILLFSIFLIIAVISTKIPSSILRKKAPTYNVDTNQTFEIKGVLRALLMDDDFKNEVMLTSGMYELAQINESDLKKLPYDAKNLYLEKFPDNPNKFLGKCVVIKGHLDTDWINKTASQREKKKRFIYQQLVFKADTIERKDFNECEGYKDVSNNSDVTSGEKKIYTGILERNLRDFPDQGSYDYTLNVDRTDNDVNESTDAIRIFQVPVVPANNNAWVAFETNVRARIAVEGYELTGAGKNKYLVVTRVME